MCAATETFVAGACVLTTCPFGQTLKADGTCTVSSCSFGQVLNAAGVCESCPIGQARDGNGVCQWPACTVRGTTRDASGACSCPVCQVVGNDVNGQACVTDPSPTNPVCVGSKILSCEESLAALPALTCDRYRVGYGGVPPALCSSLPGTFVADASVAAGTCACSKETEYWDIGDFRCKERIKDQCINIPGIQGDIPTGMYQESTPAGPVCTPLSSLGNICVCAPLDLEASDAGSVRTLSYVCDDPGIGRYRAVVAFDLATRRFVSSQTTRIGTNKEALCIAAPSSHMFVDWLER